MKALSTLLFSMVLFNSCSLIKLIKHKNKEVLIASNTFSHFDIKKDKIYLNTLFPDNKHRNMALDLGAGTTILLQNNGLNFIDSLQVVTSFGKILSADNQKQKADYFSIGAIKTDAFSLTNAVLPLLPDFQTLTCEKVVGVWGADAFEKKILILRMEDSTIAVFDTLPSLKDWTLVESAYKFPHFYVILKVGTQKIKLLFDTGSSSGIVMSKDLFDEKIYEQAELIEDYQKWYGQAFNTASGITAFDTTISAVITHSYWGNFPVDSIPITISNKIKRSVIGMDVLKRFNILLDYSDNKIYIQKNPNFILASKPGYLRSLGFKYRIVDGAKVTIAIIRANSFAEKAGLKIYDEIISINGLRVDSLDICEIDELFKNLDRDSTNNEIMLKRGDEILKFIL
jgi:predicted aspartyl protease